MKKAIITGVAGQDGSYLAELLSSKGYEVYGIDKSFDHLPIETKAVIKSLHKVDLTKPTIIAKLILEILPNEIYHLAAYHFSAQQDGNRPMSYGPFNTINILASNEIMETIKNHLPKCKYFYASSSHIFGLVDHYPQTENTCYRPDSLYAITKATGNELCNFYRNYYNIFASVGILYNHESPRRPLSFVTMQITEAAAKAYLGIPVRLELNNLDAIVDWGAAQDYANAMWLTLQQPVSGNFIISSGVCHSIREFANIAFDYLGLKYTNYIFQNSICSNDKRLPFVGDSSKIKKECGWSPEISFNDLVIEMVKSQVDRLQNKIT